TALVDKSGRLVLVGGRLADTRTAGRVSVDAGTAIAVSAQKSGVRQAKAPAGSATKAKGKHSYPNPYARGLADATPVSAELVWAVQADRSLRAAWLTDVEVSSHAWDSALIDAQTGAVLRHESNYRHSGPEGNVIREEHPDIAGAVQQTTPFSGVNGSWVAGTTTSGNNVNAYLDRNDDDLNNEYQPNTPGSGDAAYQHFNYAFTDAWRDATDVTDVAALDADRDAILTQLFYYTNVMHDWLWGYGFDEASGNFQAANPSGNGTGGDPVLAEGQDGWDFGCADGNAPDPDRCLNNANFGTNATDGSTARMQMYVWVNGGNPSRDGSMDGDVIAHEYGHGLSNRLVPGGISGGINQAGSMGEGWSDAVSFLKWGDAVVGDYATSNTTTGVRSVAYNNSNRDYASYNTSVTSPHFNGEIWASMLYDVRVLLGIDTTAQLVLDGMRSTANGPNATFINARDGILAADMTNNGGANQCAIWTAFAGRGLGQNAVSAGFHAAQVNDTTMPPGCLPTADAGGPYNTIEGTDVALTGSASAKGTDASAGALTTYEWDLDNDGDYDDATGVSASFTAVGQDGVSTVGLRVTDAFGNTDTDTSTVTVANVAPTVSIDSITPINEYGTVTVTGTISDPGWLDDLSATIGWGDGVAAVALTGTEENSRPNATLAFSVQHQYGDNGTFTVTVTGLDDDTSTAATAPAVVANVVPAVAIDSSGELVYDGVSAFVLEAGEDVTVPATSTDPGSDDLTLSWDWDDGTTSSQTSLVNPPATDPAKSPSVQPRDITLEAAHTYVGACLYDLTVTATDDDGGSASDAAAIVVTGNADRSRGSGYWLNQYRLKAPNSFTPAQLQCYLDIAGYFSMVFPSGMVRADAVKILQAPSKSPLTILFDQQALAAWLNFANDAIKLDTAVDTDGNGTLDSTFGAAMLTAETVRINPASTSAQVKAQKNIVERIVLRDGG
ncbi:MAG: M36 family metallopeptidase, partial [Mycobacteriales bacterium]